MFQAMNISFWESILLLMFKIKIGTFDTSNIVYYFCEDKRIQEIPTFKEKKACNIVYSQ